jgi:hypothetical protein
MQREKTQHKRRRSTKNCLKISTLNITMQKIKLNLEKFKQTRTGMQSSWMRLILKFYLEKQEQDWTLKLYLYLCILTQGLVLPPKFLDLRNFQKNPENFKPTILPQNLSTACFSTMGSRIIWQPWTKDANESGERCVRKWWKVRLKLVKRTFESEKITSANESEERCVHKKRGNENKIWVIKMTDVVGGFSPFHHLLVAHGCSVEQGGPTISVWTNIHKTSKICFFPSNHKLTNNELRKGQGGSNIWGGGVGLVNWSFNRWDSLKLVSRGSTLKPYLDLCVHIIQIFGTNCSCRGKLISVLWINFQCREVNFSLWNFLKLFWPLQHGHKMRRASTLIFLYKQLWGSELICRDQSLVFKFKLAPVFLSKKPGLIISGN